MTAPIGDHNVLFSIIIGNTPTEAADEVRKIGRIRRSPAWKGGISYRKTNVSGTKY
nr:hypothetical protein [uncultured Prevotella sp.]